MLSPRTWSGFLQYNETIRSSVPTGRILTSFFQVTKDDITPYDQNLSADSWNAEFAFLSAQGSGGGLEIVATDEGNYSISPLKLNASSLSALWPKPSDIGYFYVHRSDFAITASAHSSDMVARISPGSIYPGLYFLGLQVNASSSSIPFSMVFRYTSATPASMIEIHARNVSLTIGGSTAVNLTGMAVVNLTSFLQAYVGLTEFGQTITIPLGVHASFQTPTVEIGNATGYLVDQAGKSVSPRFATLNFGQPFVFEIDALYPANGMGPIMTVAVSAVAAKLVVTQGGVAYSPEQAVVEDPVMQYLRLGAVGALSFVAGMLAASGTKSPPPRDRVDRPEAPSPAKRNPDTSAAEGVATIPSPSLAHGPGLETTGNLPTLLHEAGEATRFEDERLRRSAEFYTGAVVTSLGAAVAASALASAASVASFALAMLAVLFATIGYISLSLEAYNCVRNRRVWIRLLQLDAGAERPVRSLELETKMLSASIEDLANPERTPIADLVELSRSNLLPGPDFIRSSKEDVGAFLEILIVLGLVAGLLASLFFLLTNVRESPTTYNLGIWILVTFGAPAMVGAGLLPRVVRTRKLRKVHQRASGAAPGGGVHSAESNR